MKEAASNARFNGCIYLSYFCLHVILGMQGNFSSMILSAQKRKRRGSGCCSYLALSQRGARANWHCLPELTVLISSHSAFSDVKWQLEIGHDGPIEICKWYQSGIFFFSGESFLTYESCPESIRTHNMKNRDIFVLNKVQETLYIGQ